MTQTEAVRFKKAVQDIYEAFERPAPDNLRNLISKSPADPSLIKKPEKGVDKWRIRVLPRKSYMSPVGFWNSKWCFYELAVGRLGEPMPHNNYAQVQFIYAPGGDRKIRSQFDPLVQDILTSVSRTHAKFQTTLAFGEGRFSYLWRVYPTEASAIAEAPSDFAELISLTLSSFFTMPTVTAPRQKATVGK